MAPYQHLRVLPRHHARDDGNYITINDPTPHRYTNDENHSYARRTCSSGSTHGQPLTCTPTRHSATPSNSLTTRPSPPNFYTRPSSDTTYARPPAPTVGPLPPGSPRPAGTPGHTAPQAGIRSPTSPRSPLPSSHGLHRPTLPTWFNARHPPSVDPTSKPTSGHRPPTLLASSSYISASHGPPFPHTTLYARLHMTHATSPTSPSAKNPHDGPPLPPLSAGSAYDMNLTYPHRRQPHSMGSVPAYCNDPTTNITLDDTDPAYTPPPTLQNARPSSQSC